MDKIKTLTEEDLLNLAYDFVCWKCLATLIEEYYQECENDCRKKTCDDCWVSYTIMNENNEEEEAYKCECCRKITDK